MTTNEVGREGRSAPKPQVVQERREGAVGAGEPPIHGMKTIPYGMPLALPAWVSCLGCMSEDSAAVAQFQAETGHDLLHILRARGLNASIDEATGRQRAVIVAFADWVTERVWGVEGDDSDAKIE